MADETPRSKVGRSIGEHGLGGIDIDEFRVFTDTRVFCEDCNTQYDIEDLPRNGGCESTD